MQATTNITILGAGPVGITCACTLKAAYPGLTITVLDKRQVAKRTHGLSIQSDSVAKITAILNSRPDAHTKDLTATLEGWSGQFIRTNDIEQKLAVCAQNMGITVLRGSDYELAKGDLQAILDPNTAETLTEKQKQLKPIISAASVIIAADGAHSIAREELGIELTDSETLKYMVELKYQTAGTMQPQKHLRGAYQSLKTGHITVETVNRNALPAKKPATYLVFVDKATYKSLRVPDGDKGYKGVYGNTWNLKELQELSINNPRVQSVHNTITRYLQEASRRHGSCTEEQIATLKLKIYRNTESAKIYHGTPVLFVGDANSGLVLQRGFNKGLHEVALAVDAIGKFLITPSRGPSLHEGFVAYGTALHALFNKERSAIYLKDKVIQVAQKVAKSSAGSLQIVDKISQTIDARSKQIADDITGACINFGKLSNNAFSWVYKSIAWLFS